MNLDEKKGLDLGTWGDKQSPFLARSPPGLRRAEGIRLQGRSVGFKASPCPSFPLEKKSRRFCSLSDVQGMLCSLPLWVLSALNPCKPSAV